MESVDRLIKILDVEYVHGVWVFCSDLGADVAERCPTLASLVARMCKWGKPVQGKV